MPANQPAKVQTFQLTRPAAAAQPLTRAKQTSLAQSNRTGLAQSRKVALKPTVRPTKQSAAETELRVKLAIMKADDLAEAAQLFNAVSRDGKYGQLPSGRWTRIR